MVLYKNHRDGLRHFHKDDFGLYILVSLIQGAQTITLLTGFTSGYKAFTNPELTRHVKIKHSVIRDV